MSRRNRTLVSVLGIELLALCGMAALGDLRAHPWAFLSLFAIAMSGMLAAWHCARNTTIRFSTVAVVAIVLRIPMFVAEPTLSDDVWRYLHDGRAQLAGVNPYALAPADARTAPYRGAEHARINHPDLVTIYPPAAQLAFLGNAALGSTLLGWRLILLAAELATLALLLRLGATSRNLVLYAWHPLAITEAIGSAHLEPVAIALMVAGLYAAARHGRIGAGLLLGLSIATKLVAAPLLLIHDRARNARTIAAAAATVAILYAAYGSGGSVFGSIGTFAAQWEANASIYEVLKYFTDGHRARILSATLLVCVVAALLRSRAAPHDRIAVFLAALLLLSPVAHPWYVLWLLAWLPVVEHRMLRNAALVWSATVVLSYVDWTLAEYLPVYVLLSLAALRHFQLRTSHPSPERTAQRSI